MVGLITGFSAAKVTLGLLLIIFSLETKATLTLQASDFFYDNMNTTKFHNSFPFQIQLRLPSNVIQNCKHLHILLGVGNIKNFGISLTQSTELE